MDLQVAAVKYAADALPSAHLPAIAAQALEKGYYSDALAALAFETEPIMSDVGPLFERALADCGIQIPAPATFGNDSLPTPISTRDSQFLRSAHNVLQESVEIFVLRRFAYTAGAGSGWHFIRDHQDFHRLLAASRQRTAITLVLKSPILARGIGGDVLRDTAIRTFRYFGDLALAIVPLGETFVSLTSIEWALGRFRTADAIDDHQAAEIRIARFFDGACGEDVFVARHPEWWNSDETMTAYVPDPDGVARRGAY